MKNINYYKNISPRSSPWRCKNEPDRQRRRGEGEESEREKESKREEGEREKKGKETANKKKGVRNGKKKKKKSLLSGFGNSDSWGPFVLITAEQRFCRY